MRKVLHKSAFSFLALALIGCLTLAVTLAGCSEDVKSSAKEITKFVVGTVEGAIYDNDGVIELPLAAGTSLTNVTPTITVSNKASVSPASNEAVDLTQPKTYAVTAEDGTARTYVVKVTVSSENALVGFSINGVNAAIGGDYISVTLPAGTDVTALAPVITLGSAAASVVPASGAAQDFTNPVTYTVTAEDGSVKTYSVNVYAPAAGSFVVNIDFVNDRDFNIYGLPEDGIIALSVSGEEGPTEITVSLAGRANYDSIQWRYNGSALPGSYGTDGNRNIILIEASDYTYGTHTIDLLITVGGVRYSTSLTFTVGL